MSVFFVFFFLYLWPRGFFLLAMSPFDAALMSVIASLPLARQGVPGSFCTFLSPFSGQQFLQEALISFAGRCYLSIPVWALGTHTATRPTAVSSPFAGESQLGCAYRHTARSSSHLLPHPQPRGVHLTCGCSCPGSQGHEE